MKYFQPTNRFVQTSLQLTAALISSTAGPGMSRISSTFPASTRTILVVAGAANAVGRRVLASSRPAVSLRVESTVIRGRVLDRILICEYEKEKGENVRIGAGYKML